MAKQSAMPTLRQSAHVLFVNPSGQVLLRLRDDRPDLPYPGLWDLLGGAVEAGETLAEAAVREVQEEIGIGCPPLELFGSYPADVNNNVFLAATRPLGKDYVAEDWSALNRSLFSALWLEKMAISTTIGLIVCVGALKIFFSCSLCGTLRLMFFGGIGFWNHFS